MPASNPSRLKTAVSTIGDAQGPPVIVLPGGPCRDPAYLTDLAGIGEHRALTVMHPRGTTQSGGLSRGWWADADDVIALADSLAIERMDLVAHSAGTRLALATATRFPHRVRSMVLVTPPASWLSGTPYDGAAIAARRADATVDAALTSLEDPDPTDEAQFQESWRRQAPAGYARWTEIEQTHATVGAMTMAASTAWFADIPDDAVERITAAPLPPLLVVAGDQDLLTGVQPVRDYAAVLGGALTFIENCGHYPWIEQPDGFRSVVEAWLRALSR